MNPFKEIFLSLLSSIRRKPGEAIGEPAPPSIFSPDHSSHKWIVSLIVIFGTMLVVLNSTGVNIAFPRIMKTFESNPGEIQWVVSAYMIAMAVMMPTLGRFSDLLGSRKLFLASLSLFILTSGTCAIAWSLPSLIFFRVCQGIGAGIIMPLAMVILLDIFPANEKGLAMGFFGLGVSFGPVVGPTLGGFLTEYLSWRAVFYANIPFGLLGLVAIYYLIPDTRERKNSRLDYPGLLFLAIFLVSLLLALGLGNERGWGSSYIQSLLVISLVFFLVFIFLEKLTPEPLVELGLYNHVNFSMGSLIGIFFGLSLLSSIFLISLFVQDLLGYTPLEAGLLVMPGSLLMGITMLISGRISDWIDPKILIIIGLCFLSGSAYWMSTLTLQSSYLLLAVMIASRYISLAIIWSPLMAVSLGSLPKEKVGMGAGLLNIVRQGLGGSLGVALAAAILVSRQHVHLMQYIGKNQLPAATNSVPLKGFGMAEGSMLQGQMFFADLLREIPFKHLTVAAFQDCFFVISLLSLLAIIPAFFLNKDKVSTV
jgi:DHA2 family multidrug resistance protein